jgi:hypothetical protein
VTQWVGRNLCCYPSEPDRKPRGRSLSRGRPRIGEKGGLRNPKIPSVLLDAANHKSQRIQSRLAEGEQHGGRNVRARVRGSHELRSGSGCDGPLSAFVGYLTCTDKCAVARPARHHKRENCRLIQVLKANQHMRTHPEETQNYYLAMQLRPDRFTDEAIFEPWLQHCFRGSNRC